jgi:hypothetical protein
MKKASLIAVAALTAAGALYFAGPSRPEAPKLLLDRVWIDHVPKSDTDPIGHLVMLKQKPDQAGGVIGHSSSWAVRANLFKHRVGADEMTLYFPQTKKHVKAKVKVWRCEGDAPEPFQLCLELSHDKGKHKARLYSRDEWVVGSKDLPAFAKALDDVPDGPPADVDEGDPEEAMEASAEDPHGIERMLGR